MPNITVSTKQSNRLKHLSKLTGNTPAQELAIALDDYWEVTESGQIRLEQYGDKGFHEGMMDLVKNGGIGLQRMGDLFDESEARGEAMLADIDRVGEPKARGRKVRV